MRHNRKSVKKKITWLNHTKRLCNCPPNYLSCIDAKEWVRRMIGIWEFDYEKRDVRNRKIHPATFPISLVKKVITIYTHDGEVVLDPFNGVGTTLVAAKDVKRHAIGIDLHPNYCETARERLQFSSLTKFLEKTDHNLHYETINDDALYMLEYIPRNSIDLVITSPPYANLLNRKRTNKSKHSRKRKDARLGVIEQYSDNKNDLGTMKPDRFINALQSICSKIYEVLKPNKRLVMVMMDAVPFYFQPSVIPALEEINFKIKNIIIWDKRKLIQSTGIFGWPSNFIVLNSAYEYIFEFLKE